MGVSARKSQLTKNPVAPPPPHSCTLPITGPSTTLLLLLVLGDVEWHAVVEEKKAQVLNGLLLYCLPSSRPTTAG
jgi:hypothetical protein